MLFLLAALDGGQFRGPFLGVGGQRLLALQGVLGFAQQLAASAADDRQVMQVARHLARVVAVEQQSQRVGFALQVLTIDQAFELRLLAVQMILQFVRLSAQFLERSLQPVALRFQVVQVALGYRDFLLDALEPVGRIVSLALGRRHALAQRFDLSAQFLEVALLFGDVAARRSSLPGGGGRRAGH